MSTIQPTSTQWCYPETEFTLEPRRICVGWNEMWNGNKNRIFTI